MHTLGKEYETEEEVLADGYIPLIKKSSIKVGDMVVLELSDGDFVSGEVIEFDGYTVTATWDAGRVCESGSLEGINHIKRKGSNLISNF